MLYAKVTNPDAGLAYDREKAEKLCAGYYYEVSGVEMGGSHTSIYLEGMKTAFNSVNFTFYRRGIGNFVEYDIFDDPAYNPYI